MRWIAGPVASWPLTIRQYSVDPRICGAASRTGSYSCVRSILARDEPVPSRKRAPRGAGRSPRVRGFDPTADVSSSSSWLISAFGEAGRLWSCLDRSGAVSAVSNGGGRSSSDRAGAARRPMACVRRRRSPVRRGGSAVKARDGRSIPAHEGGCSGFFTRRGRRSVDPRAWGAVSNPSIKRWRSKG